MEAYRERARQLDEEAEPEQLQNPLPFVVELRERLAKASEELLKRKRKPAKPADTL